MNSKFRKIKAGFTLIEMLVVIVIIIVLAGLVFRMSRPAGDVALRAQCVSEIELMKALIEEYHSEFGSYPPVKENSKNLQPTPYFFPDVFHVAMDRISQTKMYQFGLFSFFVARAGIIEEHEGNINPQNSVLSKTRDRNSPLGKSWLVGNDMVTKSKSYSTRSDPNDDSANRFELVTDPQKVSAFADRVRPDLDRLMKVARRQILEPGVFHYNDDENDDKYTNLCVNVSDPWGRSYLYISKKPYTTYLLLSPGPDGYYVVDDPFDPNAEGPNQDEKHPKIGKWNKDNVYGDIGRN